MHDDFDRPDRDLTEDELQVRIEALSRVLEHTTGNHGADSEPLDSDAAGSNATEGDPDGDDASYDDVNTLDPHSEQRRQAAVGRILDNLGLQPTDVGTALSDRAINAALTDWADTAADDLVPAGHRGNAASTASAKTLRVSPVHAAIFGEHLGETTGLWAKISLQHPEPEITRVVAEIALSPEQTPRPDVAIVVALAVSGRSTPIRMPLALRNYALPGGEPMYALLGSASVLYRDLNTTDALTSIQLEVVASNPQETA